MIISGTEIAQHIKENLKAEIDVLALKPKLAVILVGNNPASISYVTGKGKACASVGMDFELVRLEDTITQDDLIHEVEKLNQNETVDGILVQLPLPKHIDTKTVLEHIAHEKDVDGLSAYNSGKLFIGEAEFIPCTPLGVMEIFKYYQYDLSGKHVVVVGRSNLVGLPLARLLTQANATVTVCHSKTKDLRKFTQSCDVLVVAIGQAKFIDDTYVVNQDMVIDVGINRTEKGLCGDVDFEKVKDKVKMITPVPKGVGPLTIASLLTNTLQAYKRRRYDR